MEDGAFDPDKQKQSPPIGIPGQQGNPELFDVLNPYDPSTAAGKICFNLYKNTSETNKIKLRANIHINAAGNVEAMGREFTVLHAAPDEKNILQKNGVTYFLGNTAETVAKEAGWELFDTPAQADEFIDLFVGGEEETNKKIWNMMAVLGLYGPKIQTGFYGWREDPVTGGKLRKRSRPGYDASYAVLTKTDNDNISKYGVICRLQIEDDLTTKKLIGSTQALSAENGYPVIVSRPIRHMNTKLKQEVA